MPAEPLSLKELFLAALAVPPAERAEWLQKNCGNDPKLRRQIERMLAEHEKSQSLLDRPAIAAGSQEIETIAYIEPASEQPATVIGPYKLLQQIGEGGMGTVYMAEQTQPVQRKVALKLIKAGMDSRQVIARFEAERQALALMDHPNIAKVLDAGTTESGRPYFVMELVKGVPLTRYCDEHHLTPRQRLELFVPVCQAVQHAHQKGIIHRDLKPSNVMVCMYDGKPVPKVIDFGVAKATGSKLTERTLHTEFGAIVGTFEYMSPEQAELNQLDIDTRSDIYSLGVLLYELLTGTTPLERKRLKEVAILELLRLVREEEPPRPSTRLSTVQELPSIAANRGLEPRKLSGLVRGELDWIVMKCLEKDRNRRYETANGLARDIEHYLHDEPVNACPPSAAYQIKKFVRRNWVPMLAATVMLCSLVGGIAGTSWGLIRATKEAKAARQARDRTRQALDAMTSTITGDALTTQKDISKDQKKFLSEVLLYYQEFAGEKADDETSRARTAGAAYRVGMIESRLGRSEQSVIAFQTARDGYATLTADFPAVAAYRWDLARNHNNLGIQLAALAKWLEAERAYSKAMAIQEKLTTEFSGVPEYRRGLANSHHNRGSLLANQGKSSEAEEEYRKALAIKEKLAADYSAEPQYERDRSVSHSALGVLLMDLGRRSEAEQEFRSAMAIDEKLAASFPAVSEHQHNLACDHTDLGWLLQGLGKQPEAEQEYRKALAIHEKVTANSPTVPDYRLSQASTHNNLGFLLAGLGSQSRAEEEYRKALAIQEKLAIDFPAVPAYRKELACSHTNLGALLQGLGKHEEAEQEYRKALTARQRLVVDYSDSRYPDRRDSIEVLAAAHNNLGGVLCDKHQLDQAIAEYHEAIRLKMDYLEAHYGLSSALYQKGWPDEAIADLKQVLQLTKAKLGPDHADTLQCQLKLAVLLDVTGRAEEADLSLRKLISLAPPSAVAPLLRSQACTAINAQRWGEAVRYLSVALEIYQSDWGYWDDRGVAYLNMKKSKEALADFTRSLAIYQRAAWVWSHRAMAYIQLEKLDQAVDDLGKAIELSPTNAEGAPPRNDLAWLLVTHPKQTFRNPSQAVLLAKKSVELAAEEGSYWRTLGVAHYRAGDWKAAKAGLEKSMELRKGGDASEWFFLAMAHDQLGDKGEARKWYDQAVQWTEKNQPKNEELCRFRAEAEDLLRIERKATK
jgi:serine/threonine protein kinase/tetratricopeptide (TPR) repeat protein